MEQLKRLRTERGLSQAKLAARADIDPSTMNQIERGAREPSWTTLKKLADALDVSIAELLDESTPKVGGRSSLEPSLWNGLEEERRHEGLLRTYRAAAAFGRTVVESFKNFKPLDMQRLAAFHQLEHGLLMMRGKRDIRGSGPEDLAEAVGELEEVSALVNERLNEHLDTSAPEQREKFQQELRELTERITVPT